jgi:hypothetical protein
MKAEKIPEKGEAGAIHIGRASFIPNHNHA